MTDHLLSTKGVDGRRAEIGTALAESAIACTFSCDEEFIRTSVRKVTAATDKFRRVAPPYWGGVDPAPAI